MDLIKKQLLNKQFSFSIISVKITFDRPNNRLKSKIIAKIYDIIIKEKRENMNIAIASDHRGIEYKKQIIEYLKEKDYTIIDCSPKNTPTDDYPDFAFSVCEKVVNKEAEIGILLCRTGIGMSIAANKVKGIRCAKINSIEDAILSRNDNGANVMTFNYTEDIKNIKSYIDAFITAELINDQRHKRRVDKIISYEESH